MKPIKSTVIDLKGEAHDVEVEFYIEACNEDEAFADIETIYSVSEDRVLDVTDITEDSLNKLQEKLDSIASEHAHEIYYENKMAAAFDRAKDWNKYGE